MHSGPVALVTGGSPGIGRGLCVELRNSGQPQDYGPVIVNISSVSAYALSTNRGDYCVSKAGLSMVTQLFALRLAEHGIRVYEIRPGIIESDMTSAGRERYTQLIAE